MPFDGLVTRKVCDEFNEVLLYGKVDKIIQPNKNDVIVFIRNNRITYKLLLSINAENARTHITQDTSISNPIKPFNFCMVLRKYLVGSKLISISQVSNDRILNFTFENSNELGDKEIKTLVIEMMGKYSNIILISKTGTIVDSIKHIDFETSSVREVMPGRKYILPLTNDKLNPFSISEEIFSNRIHQASNLSSCFIGLSSLLNKENINSYTNFLDFINRETTPVIFTSGSEYIDFYFTPLTNYSTYMAFNSISEAIDTYYQNKIKKQALQSKKSNLLSIVNDLKNKLTKKLKIAEEKIESTKDMEDLRIEGELLSSNLYRILPYTKEIKLLNYYTNENTTIKLDENLSPSQNVQKIFKKYNKLKNTLNSCTLQKKQLQNELNYIDTLSFEIQMQAEIEDLYEIEEELQNQNFIKKQTLKKTSIKKPYLKFFYKGFDIFVGKNNIQNDNLTFSVANKKDLWFHVKNAPGSHTILKVNNETVIPTDVLEFAASLAAYYSKLKNSSKVEIDFTEVKNVKKIPGAKPGMVIYENYKTIYIKPNDGLQLYTSKE